MQDFAESRFWRAIAVALVSGIFYLGWAASGDRTILPVAHAGGAVVSPSGIVYTTNESGDTLYMYYTAGGNPYAFESWSYATATVTRRPIARYDQQIGPAAPLPPAPHPGQPGMPSGGGGQGGWERPR